MICLESSMCSLVFSNPMFHALSSLRTAFIKSRDNVNSGDLEIGKLDARYD